MRIASFADPCEVEITFDAYVPMTARMKGDFQFSPNYWRTGDFQKSLIEIGADRRTGAISKITLTSIDSLETGETPSQTLESVDGGLPCADLSQWRDPEIRVDMKQMFHTVVTNDVLSIRFGENNPVAERCVRSGRVVFLVCKENKLRGIEIYKLTPVDIDNLKYATGVTY